MKDRSIGATLAAALCLLLLAPASTLTQTGTARRVDPGQRVTVRLVVQTRPMVIVGGWSNVPEDFKESPLVKHLARKLFVAPKNPADPFEEVGKDGMTSVLLTRHKDPYGGIDENAVHEAEQIVKFMNKLKADGIWDGAEFDLVGFSMGGLVARSMVLKHADKLGPFKVFNLVTMGTPNHGVSPTVSAVGGLITLAETRPRPGSNVANWQMLPRSPYLNDLNGRRIPADIKVTTIAGTAEIDTAPRPPHDNDPGPTLACPHLTGKVQHPGGHKRGLAWAPCPHPEVHHPEGHSTTVPCYHPPQSRREEIGGDGLIRVTSVRLEPSEAANIIAQHVLTGLWHTQGTLDKARVGPNPKLFINGRGAEPWNDPGSTPPIPGTAVRAPHFFTHDRVKEILADIAKSL